MVTFQINRPRASFSLAAPPALGIGFNVSVRPGGGTPYRGEYVVDPRFEAQTLETKDKVMSDDVIVNPIEVARVTNPSGGKTIFIGGTTNG